MNEIEKMYEKFGIEKEYECNARFCYGELNACPLWCKNCENLISFYPPFTAEKQLELVKLLAPRYLNLSKYHDVATDKDMYGIRTDVGTYAYCHRERFEEMIAELANHLWQDLTTEERRQVREILE